MEIGDAAAHLGVAELERTPPRRRRWRSWPPRRRRLPEAAVEVDEDEEVIEQLLRPRPATWSGGISGGSSVPPRSCAAPPRLSPDDGGCG